MAALAAAAAAGLREQTAAAIQVRATRIAPGRKEVQELAVGSKKKKRIVCGGGHGSLPVPLAETFMYRTARSAIKLHEQAVLASIALTDEESSTT
jgi:hypothetical protein